jgi:hypothetical protein
MLILEIIVAAFAVWGAICTVKLIVDAFLTPKRMRPRPVVRIRGDESAEELEAILDRARKAMICDTGCVFVLVERDCERQATLRLESLGSDIRIVYKD